MVTKYWVVFVDKCNSCLILWCQFCRSARCSQLGQFSGISYIITYILYIVGGYKCCSEL